MISQSNQERFTAEAEPPALPKVDFSDQVIVSHDLSLDEAHIAEQPTTPSNAKSSAAQTEKVRIPIVENVNVKKWIKYFTVKDRERFQRFLDRGERYRMVVESVLEENDMPAELYYLDMIESGYRTEALSIAKAKGVWQFIPGTATRYGLRIDKTVDERQDPIRSTEAAAKYLRDLHNVFGSWHLAMAAYNAGEIRVLRAVFRGKSRDFWQLSKARALPRETSEYVPKFLAVVLIGMNPEKYGFRTPKTHSPFPDAELVEVPGGLPLKEISKATGVSRAALTNANPHLRNETPSGRTYEIWVPTSQVAKFKSANQSLKRIATRYPAQKHKTATVTRHIVKRGENLSLIAKKYKVSVGHLKRINGIRGNKLYVGTRLRLNAKSYKPVKSVHYTVRRGDNLVFIAKKFNTTPKKIKTLNKLKQNKILVGQRLKVKNSHL